MINFAEKALTKQSNLKRKAFGGLLAASLMLSGAFGGTEALAQQKSESDEFSYGDLIKKVYSEIDVEPLIGSFILLMLLFFITSKKNRSTLKSNSGTVEKKEKKIGTVRNLEKREQNYGALIKDIYSWNAYQASIANRYEVWSFIIDCIDQDGNTLYYTSVYFKAREINGVLHNGDEVEVEGIYNKDTKILKPEVIFNKTGNSYIEIVWKNEFDNIS